MENLWILLSLATMLLWGLYGFFAKIAARSLRDVDAAIYQAVGVVLVAGVAAFFTRFQAGGKANGIIYAVISGMCTALASFFFFGAITRGRTAVVVSMTALYPLITLGLSVLFLHETLTPKNLVGVGLAVVAIVLLST